MQLTSLSGAFPSLASTIKRHGRDISSSVGRLSSGNRITQASDDVASLSIATKLYTRTTAIRAALTNLAQADSFLQVADNALNNIHSLLQRMEQLATMANSGGLGSQERAYLDIELQDLQAEIDHIFDSTTFNRIKIFGGEQGTLETSGDEEQDTTVSSLTDIVGLETGLYDLDTGSQKLTGYVENDGTDSWLLVGRGRENWEFDGDGQGSTADVVNGLGTTAAFAPAAYDPSIIDDLIANAGLDLTDVEIRIKRAANTTGTEYQEARWRPISQTNWTWDFDGVNYAVEHEVMASSLGPAFNDADSNTRDTLSTPGPDTGNNYQRIWTFNWPGKGNIPGFSYGSSVAGTNGNDPNTFLWENSAENHATPYTEIYIRLKNADAATATPVYDDLRSINGLSIWLDGTDLDGDDVSEGLSENGLSGNAITSWTNKAGSGAATQLTVGNSPTYLTNGMNGNPTLSFDGVNDWLGLTYNTPETNYTEFVIYRSSDASGAFTTITSPVSNVAGSHDRQFGLNGGRLYNRLWNTEIISSASTYNDGQGHIATITVNSTNGQTIEADSIQVASGVKTSSNFNWDQGMVIGGHSWLGPYQGDIAEIVMFNRVLTSGEYEIVEGYLAHKWGLAGNLPIGHTYKDFSPFGGLEPVEFTISENAPADSMVGSIGDGKEDLSYYFSDGNGDNVFQINRKTGEITVRDNTLLDYETHPSFELTVSIFDPVTQQTGTQKVTITLEDVDERYVSFQIGAESSQQLAISVSKMDTTLLFNNAGLDINTQEHAEAAFDVVRNAIDIVTSRRAYYSSLQNNVGIMSGANSTELQNQDVAHSQLVDTDITVASTDLALQTVQYDASLTVAAQTTRLHEDVVLGLLSQG